MTESDQHQHKDRYMLRMPDGMRDRIKAAAEANGRSMNSEIILRLDASFAPQARDAVRKLFGSDGNRDPNQELLYDSLSGGISRVISEVVERHLKAASESDDDIQDPKP